MGANPRACYVLKDFRESRPTLRKLQISRGVILVGRVRRAHHLSRDVNLRRCSALMELLKVNGCNFRVAFALKLYYVLKIRKILPNHNLEKEGEFLHGLLRLQSSF